MCLLLILGHHKAQSYRISFFSLYTSDCRATHNNCLTDKSADDIVLTGMILNDNFINYTQEVVSFVDWCDSNHLVPNVTKTKEMELFSQANLTVVKEEDVERVDVFKYLGVMLDNKLTLRQNTDSVVKKINPRYIV